MGAGASSAPEVDPIELEIIQEAMISIVREMRVNLVATAYSSIIYEAYDFSCVLIDGQGQIVALAEDNPSHIFSRAVVGQTDVRHVRRRYPAGRCLPSQRSLYRRNPSQRHRHDVSGVCRGSAGALPDGSRPLGRCRRHHAGQHFGQIDGDFPRRRTPADREDRQRRRTEPGPVRRDDGQHARAAGAARRFHVDLGHLPGRRTAHRRIVRAVWRRDRRGAPSPN